MSYWLWLVGVLTPSIALFLNARALSVSSYLELCENFSKSFRRVKESNDKDFDYEFGELLNLTENACHIFYSWMIWGATSRLLEDYLTEVIRAVNKESKTRHLAAAAITGDRTFAEITKFAAAHDIKFLE